MSLGHVILGDSVSTTTTPNEHPAVFPDPSLALYDTTLLPSGKVLWFASPVKLYEITAQLSFMAGRPYATLVLQRPAAVLNVRFAGHTMLGGSWSRTVTEKVQLLLKDDVSTVLYVTLVTPRANAEWFIRPAYSDVV
jgi:hypothetical protein